MPQPSLISLNKNYNELLKELIKLYSIYYINKDYRFQSNYVNFIKSQFFIKVLTDNINKMLNDNNVIEKYNSKRSNKKAHINEIAVSNVAYAINKIDINTCIQNANEKAKSVKNNNKISVLLTSMENCLLNTNKLGEKISIHIYNENFIQVIQSKEFPLILPIIPNELNPNYNPLKKVYRRISTYTENSVKNTAVEIVLISPPIIEKPKPKASITAVANTSTKSAVANATTNNTSLLSKEKSFFSLNNKWFLFILVIILIIIVAFGYRYYKKSNSYKELNK